jgi:two-component system, NtrC family, response regulator AtoC
MPLCPTPPRILIVDDDAGVCEIVTRVLGRSGHACTVAQSGVEALKASELYDFDLMLLDLRLPDTDGVRLLQALREQGHSAPVIFITAHPSLPSAAQALGCAARDYLPKPFKHEQLLLTVRSALEDEGRLGSEYLWRNLETKYGFQHVLSRNPRTREVYLTAAKVARSRAPVTISGESGTGKEFLARAVHYLSDRADGPFICLNCGAFPEELLESELFGHEKGAYTSAGTAKPGLCELADGGTLFLDEIGDMSLPMQVKLLRFLQDGSFRRLGGAQERRVDARVVAATNQDLAEAIRERRFREDLYWRINVIPLLLPPLRERPEDVEPFGAHFLTAFSKQTDRKRLHLDVAALVKLQGYAWPGNIRQLHNVLLRAALLAESEELGEQHLAW